MEISYVILSTPLGQILIAEGRKIEGGIPFHIRATAFQATDRSCFWYEPTKGCESRGKGLCRKSGGTGDSLPPRDPQ